MIYITGDIHRNVDFQKILDFEKAEGKNLTKDDYLIIAGDFGGLWFGDGQKEFGNDWYFLKGLSRFPWTTLWVDGNHENFDALNKYPVEEWNGGKVHKLTDSVIHLMRGQVFTIEGLKFFTLGGASSVDKAYREEGVSWWADELPSREELDNAIQVLDDNNWEVDYVITHCICTDLIRFVIPRSFLQADVLTSFLQHLEFDFNLKFKHWYFGHYHTDKKIDDKHTCLYNKVIRIN